MERAFRRGFEHCRNVCTLDVCVPGYEDTDRWGLKFGLAGRSILYKDDAVVLPPLPGCVFSCMYVACNDT